MKMINGYSPANVYALLLVSIFASISLASNNYVNGQDGISVAFVGDISCNSNGIATLNAIKADNPDAFIILGDMSYEPSISCFFGYIKDLIDQGVTVRCDIGNHDSDEVATDELEKAYWNLCGGGASQEGFWKIQAGDITIFGINTQCDGNKSHTATEPPCDITKIIKFLKDLDENRFVVATAHEPLCESPKAKNPEFKCNQAILNEFDRIGLTTAVGADNHCSAFNGKKFIAGSGGKSHYSCSGWDWIDDANYGYLFMKLKGDKLDFVFKHFKTRAEISPHFLLNSSEEQGSLSKSINAIDNVTRIFIPTVDGTVEFKDKNGTIYYQIPTAPGIAPIPSGIRNESTSIT